MDFSSFFIMPSISAHDDNNVCLARSDFYGGHFECILTRICKNTIKNCTDKNCTEAKIKEESKRDLIELLCPWGSA